MQWLRCMHACKSTVNASAGAAVFVNISSFLGACMEGGRESMNSEGMVEGQYIPCRVVLSSLYGIWLGLLVLKEM